MPELPEVELTTRILREALRGSVISSACLNRERLAPDHSPAEFSSRLSNSEITSFFRRGKYIVMELSNGEALLTHLRMSGRFSLADTDSDEPKFVHALFLLANGKKLMFIDQRHFGFMKIVRADNLNRYFGSKKLAPEPFSNDFSKTYFREILRNSGRTIKDILLDQTKVAGLGNIYAAEALFVARIHPTKRAKEISTVKINRLFEAIRLVLHESMEFSQEIDVELENIESAYFRGKDGWRVYNREGEPCRSCSNSIKRIMHSGRSSYFCPVCQPFEKRKPSK